MFFLGVFLTEDRPACYLVDIVVYMLIQDGCIEWFLVHIPVCSTYILEKRLGARSMPYGIHLVLHVEGILDLHIVESLWGISRQITSGWPP